jgi:hypothetical protein
MTSDVDAVIAEMGRLTAEFFAAVSFEPGGKPAYGAIHGLFVEAGLLIKNSGDTPEISTVAQFIAPRQQTVDAGELTAFEEYEISAIDEVFGNVAHRLSTYGKCGTSNGASFAAEGVISTQFIATPDGWRMTSMAWDDERPGLTIPERYR